VIPLGLAGLSALNDVTLPDNRRETELLNFNYTLRQQGLTAEISCEETQSSPIKRTGGGTIGVTFASDSKLVVQNFTINAGT
jgi:hypothetical protein